MTANTHMGNCYRLRIEKYDDLHQHFYKQNHILSELKLDGFLQYDVIELESSTNNFIL